jgi:hypothetical protein
MAKITYMSPDELFSTVVSDCGETALESPVGTALDQLLLGFDGRPAPAPASFVRLWRVGRWLRTQGARRPIALRVVNDGTMIVDGRIVAVDRSGDIQDLSTTRRLIRTPLAHWKHR